jgi:hypothetical protein
MKQNMPAYSIPLLLLTLLRTNANTMMFKYKKNSKTIFAFHTRFMQT